MKTKMLALTLYKDKQKTKTDLELVSLPHFLQDFSRQIFKEI